LHGNYLILLFLRRRRRNIKGGCGETCYILANFTYGLSGIICRYIDQCQELTEASVERKDLAVYLTAVRMTTGEADEVADDAYLVYVERGTSRYLDGTTRTDALPVTFNYERWISGLGQRT
jgi:hydroxyethylthiazole kinase-like sugar kinase family protein